MNQPSYRIREGLAWREFEDMLLVVDPVQGLFHTLSGVGRLVWEEMAAGNTSQAGLVRAILRGYDVQEEQALADLETFLDELAQKGLLVAAEEE